MEKLTYQFNASTAQVIAQKVLVGVVGSGDLEVLIEPNAATPQITLDITTSVDGMAQVWQALMTRLFDGATLPAMQIEINDFGATPGVVRMRLEQALEELGLL